MTIINISKLQYNMVGISSLIFNLWSTINSKHIVFSMGGYIVVLFRPSFQSMNLTQEGMREYDYVL